MAGSPSEPEKTGGLDFAALLDCEVCQTTFEGHWRDDSITVEDIAEPPAAPQRCPSCGHEQQVEYPGWSFFTEAG